MGARRDSAADKLRRFGYDPLTALVNHATRKETLEDDQIEIAKELLPYAYPKLKAVDMQVQGDMKVVIAIGGTE